MQYKTIILELIQQQPELHERLRSTRSLLSTMDELAIRLKTHHEAWRTILKRTRPKADEAQLASEAMEIAVKEFQRVLSAAPASDEPEMSLDAAMEFLKRYTPPA